MKLAVYSKANLKANPSKVMLTQRIQAHGHALVEIDSLDCVNNFDRILVFGGDGTMLYTATHASCPIVGINLGNVGFLTQHEASVSADELIATIESSDYDMRPMLETTIYGNRQLALNDFVIKTTSSRPIFMTVEIDGKFVDKYHADGLIVATPTGSTAYSLSAGGPILSPDVNGIIINPICAHSLHSRPLIISDNSKIDITIDGENALIIADGRESYDLKDMATLQISKSEKCARFVRDKSNFYNKLLEKMNKWGVTM